MTNGNFFSGGIHNNFFYQKANNLFAFGKAQGGQVCGHALGEGHEMFVHWKTQVPTAPPRPKLNPTL